MKRSSHNIYFLLILFVAAVSCSRDKLDLNPYDSLSTGTFWKTERDATMALTGCYNTLLGSYFNMDNFQQWDSYSDNSWDWNNAVGARSAMTAPANPTTGGLITNFYNDAYNKISICNYFLANIESVQVEESKIKRWKAEVLFLRAFYYFHLTAFYGGVPLILEPYAVSDALLPKSSKEQVVQQIHADLDQAIQDLPDMAYHDGHVVKGTALLLKSKLFLYNEKYPEAASAAQQIISSGIFELYPRYNELFLNAGQGADNKEIMFSVKYLAPNFENNSTLRYGWWMSVLPFQNLVDDYECTDGLPIGSSVLYNPSSPYQNRDPRLAQSIMLPGSAYGFPGDGAPDWDQRIPLLTPPLKYNMRKYVDPAKTTVDEGNRCENDVVLMRYADVLLTFAEAQNEAAGPSADVYNALNAVRARSNMPAAEDDPSALTKDGLREKIRRERRIELAFEAQRLLDLKRWKIAGERINAIDLSQAPVQYVFQPHNYLWPFPQSEADYYSNNGGDLGQNPGY